MVGQYGEIFSSWDYVLSLPPSGQANTDIPRAEYFPILCSRSSNNIYYCIIILRITIIVRLYNK